MAILLLLTIAACGATAPPTGAADAADAAPLLIGDEPRCPHQCHRRGFCTRGVCRCHRGSAGRSCEIVERAPALLMPGEEQEQQQQQQQKEEGEERRGGAGSGGGGGGGGGRQ